MNYQPSAKTPTITHGFELLREEQLPEANSIARLYRHVRTGAELLSLINDDENKVFGATFRTPPTDSTGVAHILEHTVLCGSRKYPVKDPFVQLLKGSLKTFLNAMTFPDKTCYPVASQNLADFYNLVDVYLDAVFFPRITEDMFRQEGWHYEVDGADQSLVYKGIVFNEMKGAYSSPGSVLGRYSQQSLFPDTTYGIDSGGDPKDIPKLTHAQLRDFHARYYHPSNARLFFHGDDDPDERLRLLDEYLGAFERRSPNSDVPLQPRFSAPRRLTRTYMVGKEDERPRAAMTTVNWMFGEPVDTETDLGLAILEQVLIGTAAAPLRKALIDSGLGDAPAGGGMDDHLRQPSFSIGLKGIDAKDAYEVEALILDTLRALAESGIPAATVKAALNTTEFHLRENNTGSFPRGLALMLRSLRTWLYGGDPLAPLAFEAPLGAIKAKVADGNRYFEALIERCFLDNTHRTTLILLPDREQGERDAAEEVARLVAARSAMSTEDIASAAAAAETLKVLQETPDSAEALATIPTLRVADLPRENKAIPCEMKEIGATPVLHHELPANGIVYFDLALDLHALPIELLPYLPLFNRALTETGTKTEGFVELSERIGRLTGGIHARRFVSAVTGSERSAAWLLVSGKALAGRSADLLAIIKDVLSSANFGNRNRIRQIINEDKAGFEGRLTAIGQALVDMRLRASLHEASWLSELTGGISYLFFLRELAERVESDWPSIESALEEIRRLLVNRSHMICNITADGVDRRTFEAALSEFLNEMPSSPAKPNQWAWEVGPRFEGLTIPSKVNFVGKGADLSALGYKASGATSVVVKHLQTAWLWEKVRVQGGAYGGTCMFDRRSGGFTFASYRDPNLLGTLEVYDKAADFLTREKPDEAQLTRGIISAIGDLDAHLLPDAKGMLSLQRYLVGDTDEMLQQRRDEVFATDADDYRELAEALKQVAAEGNVVVMGSETAINAANAQRQGFLEVSRVL